MILQPLQNHEFELYKTKSAAVLLQLLKQYPELCGCEQIHGQREERMDLDILLGEIQHSNGNILTAVFQDEKVQKEQIYYWDDEGIYRCDFGDMKKKEVDGAFIRKELMELLQVDGGIEYGR